MRSRNSFADPGVLAREDQALVQIVDAAFADAARRSGPWLVCRPGCAQCCVGAFAINTLDALRLQQGLASLAVTAPEQAARIRERAHDYVERLGPAYPGDPATGRLFEDERSEERFAAFANDEPCPALDPETQTCGLYASRPMTCRVFGPPVRSGDGLGVCELCFRGADPTVIAAAEMIPDPDDLEPQLNREAEERTARAGATIVAYALIRSFPLTRAAESSPASDSAHPYSP